MLGLGPLPPGDQVLAESQPCIRVQVSGRWQRRQLIHGSTPGFCRVIQLCDDHRLPEWADMYWHRPMIKMVPNQCQPLPGAFALIQNAGSRRASCEHGITLRPLVELPMIKKHRDIRPGSLMITHSKRVLSVGSDRLAVVLRR